MIDLVTEVKPTLRADDMFRIRAEHSRLKVAFINALRRYSATEFPEPWMERYMINTKELLLAFERSMPGNNGEISSVDAYGDLAW